MIVPPHRRETVVFFCLEVAIVVYPPEEGAKFGCRRHARHRTQKWGGRFHGA